MDENKPVTPSQLRALGRRLRDHAGEAAELVDKLTAAGWKAYADVRHVNLFHPTFETEREVEDHLRSLGINSVHLAIFEHGPDDLDDADEIEDLWEEKRVC
jgi:hypothetical protein